MNIKYYETLDSKKFVECANVEACVYISRRPSDRSGVHSDWPLVFWNNFSEVGGIMAFQDLKLSWVAVVSEGAVLNGAWALVCAYDVANFLLNDDDSRDRELWVDDLPFNMEEAYDDY